MSKQKQQQRDIGLDIVRVVAILFVITGHFFVNTHIVAHPVSNVNLLAQAFCNSVSTVAVPLFVLLTGYLHRRKRYTEINLHTFFGLKKVMVSYLFFSMLCFLLRFFYFNEQHSVVEWGQMLMDFSLIPYGWYIEMYIGLFLLMPFLNITFESLHTQNNRRSLIIATVINGSLPAFVNRGGYQLLPDYFATFSSVAAFYFIGSYIASYRPQVRKSVLLSVVVLACMADAGSNMLLHRVYNPMGGDIFGFFYIVVATAVFLLLYDVKSEQHWISKIAIYTLDVYLCSWLFDALYYTFLKAHFYTTQESFFPFILLTVPMVYFSSLLVSWLKSKVVRM